MVNFPKIFPKSLRKAVFSKRNTSEGWFLKLKSHFDTFSRFVNRMNLFGI